MNTNAKFAILKKIITITKLTKS